MADPLWTEAEAHARARELLASFDRYPDHLSPDEQALVIMIRSLQREQEESARLRDRQ